jgi:hypothetical protein
MAFSEGYAANVAALLDRAKIASARPLPCRALLADWSQQVDG